jgi:hypothetical protein
MMGSPSLRCADVEYIDREAVRCERQAEELPEFRANERSTTLGCHHEEETQ